MDSSEALGSLGHCKTLLHALVFHASTRPDETAIEANDTNLDWHSFTWSQLANLVQQAAEHLGSSVVDGATLPLRLVYDCDNSLGGVVLSLASIATGNLEIPIDARFTSEARAELRSAAGGQVIDAGKFQNGYFTEPTLRNAKLDQLRQRLGQVRPDAASLVLWTSGTSASPRGVVLTNRNLVDNAAAKLTAVPQSIGDIRLVVLSLAHAYARTCDMGTWLLSGCRLRLGLGYPQTDDGSASPPTLVNVVPSLARRIVRDRVKGTRTWRALRIVGCGGAALDARSYEQFQDAGIEVIQGYGCTEASPVICSASPGTTQPGSVGRFVDGWEYQLRSSGHEAGERLFVRGPSVMLGYLDDVATTSQKVDDSGWLDTGDLVNVDQLGNVFVVGRADDTIVLDNGFKVHPLGVELALTALPMIEHAVMLNVPRGLVIAIQWANAQGLSPPEPIVSPGEGQALKQATAASHDRIKSIVRDHLPPGTPVEVVQLTPGLSCDLGELTQKGTPRREQVRKRFV